MKYNTEEKFIDPINLEDGKMTILVPKENTKIEGRIKFKGYDVWSPWISSDSPVSKTITYVGTFLSDFHNFRRQKSRKQMKTTFYCQL